MVRQSSLGIYLERRKVWPGEFRLAGGGVQLGYGPAHNAPAYNPPFAHTVTPATARAEHHPCQIGVCGRHFPTFETDAQGRLTHHIRRDTQQMNAMGFWGVCSDRPASNVCPCGQGETWCVDSSPMSMQPGWCNL